MKLRFIASATRAHAHQSTARTVTVSRGAGSLSFSSALVRALSLQPGLPGATLTEDADAPGSWYALFGSADPVHDSRPLRAKVAAKDRTPSQALTLINTALARAVLDSYGVPADVNRLVLYVLPEAVSFEGLTLWPLRQSGAPVVAPVPTPAPARKAAPPKPTPKTDAPKAAAPAMAGPARPVASIPDASTERLQQRREHLVTLDRDYTSHEEKELAKVNKELQKRGVLTYSETF
ncbi:hypothetical protein HER32_11885 [Hymenobacter sp. BT18]|uniref:hypothetical protein n=1 Tax=Hymenobacter sp. BT18 TaxID=2835648 RepID=UPI00143EC8ED|nr:hypothetical protein [Hymenobacter sp. BT18]QIX61842.1 hypothetical protein HER32_11885 [Hymenobacter sp. BT18]